jgi:hypothetical protein
MGASFGPMTIEREGVTSLNIPPVQEGAADPRQAWLNLCNDTGVAAYALRAWVGSGKGQNDWRPLTTGGFNDTGLIVITSGQRVSAELPKGTCVVTLSRKWIDNSGRPCEADDPQVLSQPFAGPLTCCIERGPVVR